jgi:hypothetical protein
MTEYGAALVATGHSLLNFGGPQILQGSCCHREDAVIHVRPHEAREHANLKLATLTLALRVVEKDRKQRVSLKHFPGGSINDEGGFWYKLTNLQASQVGVGLLASSVGLHGTEVVVPRVGHAPVCLCSLVGFQGKLPVCLCSLVGFQGKLPVSLSVAIAVEA